MRTYTVWTDDMKKLVEVRADDVNLESEGTATFWNFTRELGSDNPITVAAFPYEKVAYIVSEAG